MEDILKNIYEDPSNEGSYGGIDKLYRVVKHMGYTRKQVKEWLEKNENYTTHKPVNRRISRPRVVVSAMNQQWGADTVNMTRYEDFNEHDYFLILIDIFTRFVFTVRLYTLTGSEMKTALESVMKHEKPEKLRTDHGSEFKSNIVQSYLKSIGVHHFFTTNEVKENFSERAIQTIKKALRRVMQQKKTNKWERYLEAVTFAYNKTKHSSIKMSPMLARERKDWVTLWKNQYEKKERPKYSTNIKKKPKSETKIPVYQTTSSFKFDIGDHVRLSKYKSTFERAYDQKWSDEIYTIIAREVNQNIDQYKVKTWTNEIVLGKFYEQQLNKVRVSEDTVYTIEKVLKKEKRNGIKGSWVKWEGWGKEHNSWIPDTNIKDIK